MFEEIISFIRKLYINKAKSIPLHEPVFVGKEKDYVLECIESTFVSSVGKYVDRFEQRVAEYTGAKYAIATVNGTAALQVALLLAGVKCGDDVLTQSISFVATANAISYCGANPVFLDSDRRTLGLDPDALELYLDTNCIQKDDGFSYNKINARKIAACVPVHVFGHPFQINKIKSVCDKYNIALVEDAAEALGSLFKKQHLGTFGKLGILSFNGNKIITTGGGGMILTDDESLAKQAKHLTTTAKSPHPWEYVHDHIGFNYRLPNINAALGCAQMEMLPTFLKEKRKLALSYKDFFNSIGVQYHSEPNGSTSNYWLNAIFLKDAEKRDAFLVYSNKRGVTTRPLWSLVPTLPMYNHCRTDKLENAYWLRDRVINIPSGVRV